MTKPNYHFRGSCLAAGLIVAFAMDAGVKAYAQSDDASSITVTTYRDVPHLDRTQNNGGNLEHGNLMDPLIRSDDKGAISPGLIDSWEQVDEGRTRLFLRQDVTFSDGEKFNAEALKVNMDRGFEVSNSTTFATISEAEVVDEYTLDLLHEPQSLFGLLSGLGVQFFTVSPRQILEDPQSIETAPITTGPYKVESYEPGREALWVARDDYWGADVEGWGAPSIKNVTVRWSIDPGVGLAGLLAGELDLVQELTPENAALVSEDMRVIRPSPEMYFLRLGLKDKFTSDPRVREAINLAIDREALNAPFLGMGEPATQLWSSQSPAWADRGAHETDVERARELIKEAGAEGAEMEMIYSTSYKAGIGLMSQAVAAMIEDIGITVKLTDLDGTRYREVIRELDDPAPLTTISVGYDGPDTAAYPSGRITCSGSMSTYCNEDVDRLLNLAKQSSNAEETQRIMQEMMDLIEADMAIIPLIAPPLIWGKSAELQVTPSYGDLMDLPRWTIDR